MADPKRQRHKQGFVSGHHGTEHLLSLFHSLTAASTQLPRWRMADSWWPAPWSTIPSVLPTVSLMPASAHCVPTTCKYLPFSFGEPTVAVVGPCPWGLNNAHELYLKHSAGWVPSFNPVALFAMVGIWDGHLARPIAPRTPQRVFIDWETIIPKDTSPLRKGTLANAMQPMLS